LSRYFEVVRNALERMVARSRSLSVTHMASADPLGLDGVWVIACLPGACVLGGTKMTSPMMPADA
jgi:hypothetical protein